MVCIVTWELLTVVTTDGTCVSRLRSLLVWRWGCRHIAGICYYGFTITSNKLFLHMHLLYNCRLGIYYSPLLTVVVVIKLWLIFYLKRVSVSSTSAVSVCVVWAHRVCWPQRSLSLIASLVYTYSRSQSHPLIKVTTTCTRITIIWCLSTTLFPQEHKPRRIMVYDKVYDT